MTICRERGNIFKQSASRSFTSEISGLRKQYGMRGWRNWQTRTFEVRVVYPWGFESPPSHQKPVHIVCWFFFLCEGGGSNRAAAFMPQAISPVQQRRPQPAAETGRSCWGRVLIFQSPAKGLRKNQQTQPVQAPAVRFRQGSQRLGMSIGMTAVLWWAVQDENRNEQRQGITMTVVSCLLL